MTPNILHLPKWYPNRTDDMAGIFIKRHIKCTLDKTSPIVIFGTTDPELKETTEIVQTTEDGILTYRFYYKKRFTGIGIFDKLIKLALYFYLLNKCFKKVSSEYKIDLIHVHVLLRSGIFAYLIRNKIKYIVTEHWNIYLPIQKEYLSGFRVFLSKIIAKKASNLNTVSKDLLKAMNDLGIRSQSQEIIPNVVNTDLFSSSKNKQPRTIFSLITVMEFTEKDKNLKGLLNVLSEVQKQHLPFHLDIVGYGQDEDLVKKHALGLGITEESVTFHGKMYHQELSKFMASKDAFVLFSKSENLPCVIVEAMACGLPVVASNVGGISEMVKPEIGYLVESMNEKQLLDTIIKLKENINTFDSGEIEQEATSNYSQKAIGKKLTSIYKNVL